MAGDSSIWRDSTLAAALFAVDPPGSGGVSIRGFAGPVRDAWLVLLRAMLPASAPMRRVPNHITDNRLLGGLDLAATLSAGRPVAQRGILAEADGGIIILAMAERLTAGTAARLSAVLDTGIVVLERDGVAMQNSARLGMVMLDEGIDENERSPAALLDRISFHIDLSTVGLKEIRETPVYTRVDIESARQRLPLTIISSEMIAALCGTALALGIPSLRASLLAMRVARAAAALDGRDEVIDEDAALAARLVFAPRATVVPSSAEAPKDGETDEPENESDDSPENSESDDQQDEAQTEQRPIDQPLEDIVLEAAKAAIPANLLAQLQLGGGVRRPGSAGRAGMLQQSAKRGRPIGARRGIPRSGARLNVIETLRAAAPWQRLRQREAMTKHHLVGGEITAKRIYVKPEDFHVTRFKERAETTIIFAVDASGSSALNRLAEAKGAVELLLADCYVRRDRVAVIAFRGRVAELLLPPTRSLVRAKRSLAGLPGGGGTPLAVAIDTALSLADAARRRGETPTVVFLTDGRANIARDGTPGRARAEIEATAAAHLMRAANITTLLVDTSPQPQELGSRLAAEMGARYLPLPYADANALSKLVKTTLKLS